VSELRDRELAARHSFAFPARFAFCVITAFAVLPARAQTAPPANTAEDPEAVAMKDLAGNVAQAVKKSHLNNLVVMDFQGPGGYSLLGRRLADDLHAALAADPAVKLVDRSKYLEFVSREALLIPQANEPDPANWISSQVAAKSFVTGEYTLSENDVVLHIKIYDCPKPRYIRNLDTTFSSTAELSSLNRRTLAATGEDALSAEQKSSFPLSGTRGYSVPECLQCPQPPFSALAVSRRVSCTINLIAEVDGTGAISNVRVTTGFFYGLNDEATDGVKKWRLRPAIGPDGKPATVQQVIEVTFRMYRK
jgi:TonB-like protein